MRRIEEGAKLPGNGLLRLLPCDQLTGVLLQMVRSGAQKLASFNLGGLIVTRTRSRLARAVQPVFKQRGIGRLQSIRFDSHRHGAYTPFSMSWRQTSRQNALPKGPGGIYRKKDTQLSAAGARDPHLP
jgi:hypothetical protein